ncbi:MAG: FHA domain-containing protein [Anaerolineae bacterium]
MDTQNPNSDNPSTEPSQDSNHASNDLSQAAEEARRLLKQDNQEALEVEEENGNTTNDLQQEALKALHAETQRQRDAEEQAQQTTDEQSTFTASMRLRLTSTESFDPIVKVVQGEMIVGRSDNVTDYVPDIDLTPHGAYRLGLSRRHAVILCEDERLFVKDLNSRNGTFVNGTIVPGNTKQLIQHGDELRFGNLAMQVSFEG